MKYGSKQNVASWIDDSTFEILESLRWPARMSRSEFVRRAINLYINSIKDGMRIQGRTGSKHGSC